MHEWNCWFVISCWDLQMPSKTSLHVISWVLNLCVVSLGVSKFEACGLNSLGWYLGSVFGVFKLLDEACVSVASCVGVRLDGGFPSLILACPFLGLWCDGCFPFMFGAWVQVVYVFHLYFLCLVKGVLQSSSLVGQNVLFCLFSCARVWCIKGLASHLLLLRRVVLVGGEDCF